MEVVLVILVGLAMETVQVVLQKQLSMELGKMVELVGYGKLQAIPLLVEGILPF